MRKTTIINNEGIRVVLFGGGTAVLIENRYGENQTPAHLFLQGDDATQILDEVNAIEAKNPEKSFTQIWKLVWSYWCDAATDGFADDELATVDGRRMPPGY